MNDESSRRTRILSLFAAAFSFFMALVILSQSPLRFWNHEESGVDSSVFQTVAMMMERGLMPYRDSFDHKGPLIYLIDYLGLRISPLWGIWLIEVIFMWGTLFAMYRIARLLCGPAASCGVIALAALPLLNLNYPALNYYFEGGNYVEEYAMPFIAVSLYIFLDYLYNGRVSRTRLVICGLCMGGVCLLRVNMIPVWVVFCSFIAARCIRKKEFAALGQFVCWFLIGVCAIVLPVLAWLALNGALVPFWNIYILFNMAYTSGPGGIAGLKGIITAFMWFFLRSLTLVSFLLTAYAAYTARAQQLGLYCVYAVCLITSALFAAISGRTYNHYGMILVPLLAFPLAWLCERCEKGILNARGVLGWKAALILLLAAVTLPYLRTARTHFQGIGATAHFNYSDITNEVCGIINENTAPDDPISIMGTWDVIYIASGRPHATTYSYLFPIGNVVPAIMDDYFRQLGEELPKLIILASPGYLPVAEDFLREHDYVQIWQEPTGPGNYATIYSRRA